MLTDQIVLCDEDVIRLSHITHCDHIQYRNNPITYLDVRFPGLSAYMQKWKQSLKKSAEYDSDLFKVPLDEGEDTGLQARAFFEVSKNKRSDMSGTGVMTSSSDEKKEFDVVPCTVDLKGHHRYYLAYGASDNEIRNPELVHLGKDHRSQFYPPWQVIRQASRIAAERFECCETLEGCPGSYTFPVHLKVEGEGIECTNRDPIRCKASYVPDLYTYLTRPSATDNRHYMMARLLKTFKETERPAYAMTWFEPVAIPNDEGGTKSGSSTLRSARGKVSRNLKALVKGSQ
nr:uncharacterized protein CI109_004303 [Kwoniella shandongensis]KAA5527243.1 hypothetical protein CI109_004303 [Kwoniella shandongensis]